MKSFLLLLSSFALLGHYSLADVAQPGPEIPPKTLFCMSASCYSPHAEPTCASNGKIYISGCHKFTGTCTLEEEHVKTVPFSECVAKCDVSKCVGSYDNGWYKSQRLCADDGKRYDDPCQLIKASCKKGEPIKEVDCN